MRESEIELLRSKNFDLCEITVCNASLLNFLLQEHILTTAEIGDIKSKPTDVEKAMELYSILPKKVGAFKSLLEGLAKTNQTEVIEILKDVREIGKPILSLASASSGIKSGISFGIYPPVHNFIGRVDELTELHEIVLRSKRARRISVITQLTSISGLGGIGKTQLAREYANVHGKEFDDNLIWLNADTENNLSDSFRRLANEALHISTTDGFGKEKAAEVIAQEAYKYFEESKVLFVFDNAENVSWLEGFMPKSTKINSNLHMLMTSRDKEWGRDIEVVKLGGLSEEDAVTLVQNELKIDADDEKILEDVHELVKVIQCFTLALQQAIAYIYEQQITKSYSIQDYLKEFETKAQLLSFREKGTLFVTFEATTEATWNITMDKIKKDREHCLIATQIMNLISYLTPDNISRDIFYELPSNFAKFEEKVDQKLVREAVRLLVRYSMLNERNNQSVLSVHRLVQAVTRSKLASEGREEKFLNFTLKIFSNEKCLQQFASHAMSIWRHVWKYEGLGKAHFLQILHILGHGCNAGYQEQGIKFANEAIENFNKYFGKNNPCNFDLERYIAKLYNSGGFFEKSLAILNKLLGKITSVYRGQQDQLLATIQVLDDKGVTLRFLEKYEEAIQAHERALELGLELSGENKAILLDVKTNYAVSLVFYGLNKDALEMFQELRNLYISNNDTNSLKFLQLQMYIANLKGEENMNEEAELLYKNIMKSVFPTWTINVTFYCTLCCGFGKFLIKLKRYDEALVILEECLLNVGERFGDHHFRTLSLMGFIANAYRHRHLKGDLEKALGIHEKVREGLLRIFGGDSVKKEVLRERRDYAILLCKLGHHDKSFEIFRQTLEKMKALPNFKKLSIQFKLEYALAIESSAQNLETAMTLLNEVSAAYQLELKSKPGDSILLSQLQTIQADIQRIEKKLINVNNNQTEN